MNLKDEVNFILCELDDCSKAVILSEYFLDKELVSKEDEADAMRLMIKNIEEFNELKAKLETKLTDYFDECNKSGEAIDIRYRKLYKELTTFIN